jgi:heat shock protein HslJ
VSLVLVAVLTVLLVACGSGEDDRDSSGEAAGSPETLRALTAHDWVLDRAGSTPELAATGSDITLAFTTERSLGGSSGCNTYGGTFTLDEEAIDVGPLESTQMACEPTVMKNETAYVSALERVREVDVTHPNELVLTGPDDVELRFSARDLTEEIAREWTIVNVNTGNAVEGVIEGTDPTLAFESDGTLTMTTGCNRVAADWRLDGNRIVLGEPAQGLVSCPEPDGVMDQEAALTEALRGARSVEISGNTLTLLRGDGTIALVASDEG